MVDSKHSMSLILTLMYFSKMNSPDGSTLKCKKVGNYNKRKKGKSVIYDTKSRAHGRKELVNSIENTALAAATWVRQGGGS